MKLNIYSVKDNLSNFMQPFYLQNDELAKRAFANTINSEEPSQIKTNYADMNLYRIGTFDDDTGEIVGQIEYLGKGADFKWSTTAKATDQQ